MFLMTNDAFLFPPHSCSKCVYMEKCTSQQGEVGASHLVFSLILTALLKSLHFISRWGSLPLSKTFSGAIEGAQSFQKVLPVVIIVVVSCVYVKSSVVSQ